MLVKLPTRTRRIILQAYDFTGIRGCENTRMREHEDTKIGKGVHVHVMHMHGEFYFY